MDREKAIAELAKAFSVTTNVVEECFLPSWWEKKLASAKTVSHCRAVLFRMNKIAYTDRVSPHIRQFAVRRAMEILQREDSRIMAGV